MIGLIVDGEGDYAAFRARYSGRVRVFKTDGPRGHLVDEREIVGSARKQIRQMQLLGCKRIAIVTDLESRPRSAESFRLSCEDCARSLGHTIDLLVFVADRMLENWFLADIAHVSQHKSYLRNIKRQKRFESTDGKSEIKKLFISGHDYNEVRHGREIFPLVRGDFAAGFSPSFSAFRAELGLD